jgi:rubrerythrin
MNISAIDRPNPVEIPGLGTIFRCVSVDEIGKTKTIPLPAALQHISRCEICGSGLVESNIIDGDCPNCNRSQS